MKHRWPGATGVAFVTGAVLAFACAASRAPTKAEGMPGLVFPARFAEGEERDAGARDAEPAAIPEPAKRSSSPPDPEPLRQPEQYEYTFAYESGATRVVAVRPVRFRDPVVTARKMGRFALELWVGTELVERVRFDFPLLAAEDPPPKQRRPLNQPPSLAGGVLKATVLVPASVRARRAVLFDRGTNVETELNWPPTLGGAADAGATADGGSVTDGGVAADGGKPPAAKRTP